MEELRDLVRGTVAWLGNEEGLDSEARTLADDAAEGADDMDSAAGALAGTLKDWVEDMAPDLGASMFADLLGAALSEVDWYELAESYLSECNELVEG